MKLERKDLPQAIDLLCETMKQEPDYRESWKANIAVAFQDEIPDDITLLNHDPHGISNRAADRFLDNLTRNVDNKKVSEHTDIDDLHVKDEVDHNASDSIFKKIEDKVKFVEESQLSDGAMVKRFDMIIEEQKLHKICVGIYYAMKIPLSNYVNALEFGKALSFKLRKVEEFGIIPSVIYSEAKRIGIAENYIEAGVEYAIKQFKPIFGIEDEPVDDTVKEHDLYVYKSRLLKGMTVFRNKEDSLVRTDWVIDLPISRYINDEPLKTGDEKVCYNDLEVDKTYRWNGEGFEVKIDSEADKGNRDIPTNDYIDYIKELEDITKLISNNDNPCSGCSQYARMLKGETVVCHCVHGTPKITYGTDVNTTIKPINIVYGYKTK